LIRSLTLAFRKKLANPKASVRPPLRALQLHLPASDAALNARYGRWRERSAMVEELIQRAGA
jgi:hypothetical protein